jgi:predicted MFS family arabinose efflux permease
VSDAGPRKPPAVNERHVILVLMAVQFVNILDFMMVMPMGPFFSEGLGLPGSQVGVIAASYTAAAAASGLLGSLFLDRFDRRSALVVCLVGLALGTAAGGLAVGQKSLMLARVLAGLFGGPATSLGFSIIADVIPAERRGRAMGEVMSAFAIASIVGVPAGLWVASHGGWRMPFFCMGALGIPVIFAAARALPSLRGHLANMPETTLAGFTGLFTRRPIVLSYLMTTAAMVGGFMIIPNLPTHLQRNLGFPRDDMWQLYLAGGVVSWVLSRFVVGRLIDRHGSFAASLVAVSVLLPIVYVGFGGGTPPLPLLGVYMIFFFGMAFRNVSFQTLATKVPEPHERARFQSIQSAVNHVGTSVGAVLSSRMLQDTPDGRVAGMHAVALVFIGMHALFPALVWLVEREVRAKRAAVAVAT